MFNPANQNEQEQWKDESPLSTRAQLIQIFSAYTQLGKDGQQPYQDMRMDRRIRLASDLTEDERTKLTLLRVPASQRRGLASDGFWLRTCYKPGSDAAFTAAREACLSDLSLSIVLDDAGLYDFGDDWQRIFSVMPQLLTCSGMTDAQTYREAKETALQEAKQAVIDDREIAVESGYDPYEDAAPLPVLYGWYHWACATGYIFILDDATLETGDEVDDDDRGKVLAVWYDEYGKIVRSTRESFGTVREYAGLLMDAFVSDHGIWTEAMVGEEYDHYDEEDEDEDEEEEGEEEDPHKQ